MGFNETDILCPICQFPLTDVDGMLECQNPKSILETHFIYGYRKPYFNFKIWSETEENKKAIQMRLNAVV